MTQSPDNSPGQEFVDPFKIVTRNQISPDFLELKDSPHLIPANIYLRMLLGDYGDPDGNFLEQFQSKNGFPTRLWEVYLDRTFRSLNFEVERLDRPDFHLTKDGVEVFVEATTSNVTQKNGPLYISDNDDDFPYEIGPSLDYFAFKIGGPLYTKLKKHYWELPNVQNKPLVFAIKPEHKILSKMRTFMDFALYLYGVDPNIVVENGERVLKGYIKRDSREFRTKKGPGGFFVPELLPEGVANVSGVLCNVQGGLSRFLELGTVLFKDYLERIDPDAKQIVNIIRHTEELSGYGDGSRTENRYNLTSGEGQNVNWEDGLVYFHNPLAENPLPVGYFGPNVLEFTFDYENNTPVKLTTPETFIYRAATAVFTQGEHGPLVRKFVY